ncbi:MAG: DUF2163 domain-containing protein [Alphaproteobacteria bacterium]|nr:DUF2163 domain-containing protein [Alphaproteobacteria bacterium]
MRQLPKNMQTALAAGVTNLCYCWQITRRDGVQLGLTDHDRALQFNDITFHAKSGIDLTALESRLGLAPHGAEASGVLGSPHLTDEDLMAGAYDDAAFTLWLVDWGDVDNRVSLLIGTFGAIQHHSGRFTVTLRGQGQSLNQPQGQIYQSSCSADLGDTQCRFNVARAPYQWVGQITAIDEHKITLPTLPTLSPEKNWFREGHILTARNHRLVVREDKINTNSRILVLWETPPPYLQAGDTITLQTGCDKAHNTCVRKFQNAINFQGFPTLAEESLLLTIGGA